MSISNEINILLKKFQEGNKLDSYEKLLKILEEHENDNHLRFNVAVIEQNLGLFDEARFNYNLIIKNSNNLKSIINLYNLEIKENKYQDALLLINKAIALNQHLEFLYKDKALVFLKLNRVEECIDFCYLNLKRNNRNLDILNILAVCFLKKDDLEKSEKIILKILNYNSKNIEALNSLGRIYHKKEDTIKAEKYFLNALKINSSSLEVLNNIAGLYRDKGKYKKSINFYLKALKINSKNPLILNNLSKSYLDVNNINLARKYAQKAFMLDSKDSDIQLNLACINFKIQDYKTAWAFYDGRLKNFKFSKNNLLISKISKKILLDKNLNKNLKLLVLREQGVGDEILYASMYNELILNVPSVHIECDKRFLNLFKKSFKNYENNFIQSGNASNDNKKLKKFDNVLYAGSLGKYFRNHISDFNTKPYLIADRKKINEIKKYLLKYNKEINIGISWKSFNTQYSNDRSLDLIDLKKIFETKNCNFINIQYGDVEQEVREFTRKTKIEIITLKDLDLLNDFDNLSALLKNLDLFFTINNTTAHLAGALGVKTILIKSSNHVLPHYFNQTGNKTPWYNSIRFINKKELKNNKLVSENLNN
tara:strand:+ start:771 stop:2555 length:1785 start_codon:yes stop_codon:yes gene_type:complete